MAPLGLNSECPLERRLNTIESWLSKLLDNSYDFCCVLSYILRRILSDEWAWYGEGQNLVWLWWVLI